MENSSNNSTYSPNSTSTQLSPSIKQSFESQMKHRKSTSNSPIKKYYNNKHGKLSINPRLKFIDEVDKTKSISQIIEIESYKNFNNIELSNEKHSQSCNCIFI